MPGADRWDVVKNGGGRLRAEGEGGACGCERAGVMWSWCARVCVRDVRGGRAIARRAINMHIPCCMHIYIFLQLYLC